MSNTTYIKGLDITEPEILRRAVAALRDELGIDVKLSEDRAPREWAGRRREKCEFCVELPGCRFDVGLKLDPATGKYGAVLDMHGGEVASVLGYPPETGKDPRALAIGKLLQQYTRFAAVAQAEADGFTVTSCMLPSGEVELLATAY